MKRVPNNLIEIAACTELIVLNKAMMKNIRAMFKSLNMSGASDIIKKKNYQETIRNTYTGEFEYIYSIPTKKAMHQLCVALSKFNFNIENGALPTNIQKVYGNFTYSYDEETGVIFKHPMGVERWNDDESIPFSVQHILNVFFKEDGIVSIVLSYRQFKIESEK